jgi:nitrite reductase (cytochrome c-552)
MKISDHHVRSPLLNINRACQTCHKWPEEELRARVETIQDRTFELRNLAMDALVRSSRHQGGARAGRTARAQSRRATPAARAVLPDFIEAENSMGFHAPQEAVRILGACRGFAFQDGTPLIPISTTLPSS